MVLDEIVLTGREDGTVVDEDVPSDMGIRDDDVKLVAYEKRVDRTELFCPFVQRKFGELGKVRKTEKRTRRDWIAVLVDDIFTKEIRDES